MKRLILCCFPLLFLVSCKVDNVAYNWHKPLAVVMIVLIIILFIALALYSNLLRDNVNDCAAFDQVAAASPKFTGKKKPKNPYSLARVQLAVWTVIIASSFIYLALWIGGDCANTPINQTALILMGIGVGVTATSSVIDQRDISQGLSRHQNQPSQGFFFDILSDGNGVSVHRFQNVVWTAIAMVLYILQVRATTAGCNLPELSQTLLILTGISSAAYVMLKANENASATENQPDAVTTTAPLSASPVVAQPVVQSTAGAPTVPPLVDSPNVSVQQTTPVADNPAPEATPGADTQL